MLFDTRWWNFKNIDKNYLYFFIHLFDGDNNICHRVAYTVEK